MTTPKKDYAEKPVQLFAYDSTNNTWKALLVDSSTGELKVLATAPSIVDALNLLATEVTAAAILVDTTAISGFSETSATALTAIQSIVDQINTRVDTSNTLLTSLDSKNTSGKIVQKDDAGSGITYFGWADPGYATSAAFWRILRLDKSADPDFTILYADGNTNYDNVWDNRASLSYS